MVFVNTKEAMKQYKKQRYRCRAAAYSNDVTPRASVSRTKRVRRAKSGSVTRRRASSRSTTSSTYMAGPAGERDTYEPYIREAASKYRVPANLIRAVIKVESDFHPRAVSSAGAKGLMQLMPRTARILGVDNTFDPRQNILGGTRYLRTLANQFKGDKVKLIAAYHAGPGAVSARNGVPYKATERYVRKVLTHWARYKASGL